MSEEKYIKPLIKWAGGKTQILDILYNNFPRTMNNYHDVFLGGGSVLLMILEEERRGNIEIRGKKCGYDCNPVLISMFKNVQQHPKELYEEVMKIKREYMECEGDSINRKPEKIEEAKESKNNYYYWIRNKYNKMSKEEKSSIRGSAMFIFLNKTCFRGLYREGPNGFNVPFGNYENPSIVDEEHLLKVSNLIHDVEFFCCDFEETIKNTKPHDFVYLDPPYVPIDKTTFVKYVEGGFNKEQHEKLFMLCNGMLRTTKKFLLNNHNVELVKDSFTHNKLKKLIIESKRRVNSKNPESVIDELIIMNYEL